MEPTCYALTIPGIEGIAAAEIEQRLDATIKRTAPLREWGCWGHEILLRNRWIRYLERETVWSKGPMWSG